MVTQTLLKAHLETIDKINHPLFHSEAFLMAPQNCKCITDILKERSYPYQQLSPNINSTRSQQVFFQKEIFLKS